MKYDFIVFGASGYTGQYVVEEIARTCDSENISWAIAGRQMRKLQEVLTIASKITGKDLEEIPIIIADVGNEKSLIEMAKQAKIVLNCVGPYRFYGTPMVKACIETGTHHIDICGETEWLERMQLLYDSKAKESNVYVLGACGFDSIPAEMGMKHIKEAFKGDLYGVESFLSINSGKEGMCVNSGTWLSAIHSIANSGELKSVRRNLYEKELPKPEEKLPKRSILFYNNDLKKWCLPFLGSDKAIVYRTEYRSFFDHNTKPVPFQPYTAVTSLFHVFVLAIIGAVFGLFTRFNFGIRLLESYPRLFSFGLFSNQGPTRKQVSTCSFDLVFVGHGKDGTDSNDKQIVTKISGPEAGYITTPICMVSVAYTLLKETSKLPKNGGVYTPGYFFKNTSLIDRLKKRNITFEVVENNQ